MEAGRLRVRRRRRAAVRRRRARRAALRARPSRSSRERSTRCAEAVAQLLADQPSVAIGLIDQEIVVGDTPLPQRRGELRRADPTAAGARHRAHRLRARCDARRAQDARPARWRIPSASRATTASASCPSDPASTAAGAAAHPRRPHQPRRARRHLRRRRRDDSAPVFATRSTIASSLWDMAQTEGQPDPDGARSSSTTSRRPSRRTARRWWR